MKILTVVVPSYNTEKYIDECLPTLISKTIDDIEILLVNDGSTDNTLEKLRSFEKRWPNSICVIDKKNGGHGSVINRGISEAKGKYFKVIDGDDWVKSDNFDRLINDLKRIDADLILNSYVTHNIRKNTDEISSKNKIQPNHIYSFDEVTERIGLLALHGITYRTSLLQENGICLQEKCFYEDAEYSIYPVMYLNNMLYLDYPVYVYRLGSPTQSVSPENAVRNRVMLNTIVDNLVDFYNEMPTTVSDEKRAFITRQISRIIQNMYGVYLKMPIKKEAFNGIQSFNRELKTKSNILYKSSGNYAIKLLRLNIYPIYCFACKVFERKRKRRGY